MRTTKLRRMIAGVLVTGLVLAAGSLSVALPKADKDLAGTALAAGLVDTSRSKGRYTVFAPTEEAFRKLPAGTVEKLLKPENKEKLKAILLCHVLPEKVTSNGSGEAAFGKDGERRIGEDCGARRQSSDRRGGGRKD